MIKSDTTKLLTPRGWAERNSRINEFGSRHYSLGVCVLTNIVDPKTFGYACEWTSPYGFVPKGGCLVHD